MECKVDIMITDGEKPMIRMLPEWNVKEPVVKLSGFSILSLECYQNGM